MHIPYIPHIQRKIISPMSNTLNGLSWQTVCLMPCKNKTKWLLDTVVDWRGTQKWFWQKMAPNGKGRNFPGTWRGCPKTNSASEVSRSSLGDERNLSSTQSKQSTKSPSESTACCHWRPVKMVIQAINLRMVHSSVENLCPEDEWWPNYLNELGNIRKKAKHTPQSQRNVQAKCARQMWLTPINIWTSSGVQTTSSHLVIWSTAVSSCVKPWDGDKGPTIVGLL